MHITFVKKILADGSACRKCNDVIERLEKNQQMSAIDETLIADERDPSSAGMLLAERLKVERAPFFVVKEDTGHEKVYTVYFKFVKEVLNTKTSEIDENREILENSSDLDFL